MDKPIEKFRFKKTDLIVFSLLALAGLAALWAGFGQKETYERTWANFILNHFYWMALCFSGVFFAALQFLSGAGWSATIRRISEAFIGFLPIVILTTAVVVYALANAKDFHLTHMYHWLDPKYVAKDAILQGKEAYLNFDFFAFRQVALVLVVGVLGGWMVYNSLKQDISGEAKLTRRNAYLSAPFLLLFGWAFTFVAIDLLKSMDAHWFSTMFGVYAWAGLFYSGLAMLAIFSIVLKKRGYLVGYFNENHLHDLGKLMFAFVVFWGYVGFSQYMLIWYANLPEETPYMILRTRGVWTNFGIFLMVFKFGLPFLFLISRNAKRSETWMLFVSIWMLVAQWVDLYWVIFPQILGKAGPSFHWTDFVIFLGFAGLFFLFVGSFLGRKSVVAVKDPLMDSALSHHQ